MDKQYFRLAQPLVREKKHYAAFRPATWNEALDRTVTAFKAARDKNASQSFGMFSCSKATNEMNFVAQKFARVVMGSNNIDSCNRT